MRIFGWVALFVIAVGVTGRAQDDGSPGKREAAPATTNPSETASSPDRKLEPREPPRRATLTPEREAAALMFVRQHHAELVELLEYLKVEKPKAYEQAVLDLFRVSERLAQQQEQNYDRYEFDLALWKVQSRIELLAARLKMAGRDSPEGESLVPQLKKLLAERHDLRAERLALERRKTAERLEKLDRQLENLRANREQAIERDLRQLVGPAPKNKPK